MPYAMKDGKKMKIGNYGPNMIDPKYIYGGQNSIRAANQKKAMKKNYSHNPGY